MLCCHYLEIVNNLQNPFREGLLCTSFVSIKNKSTYRDNKYGVSLECEQVNAVNAANHNQSSGCRKDLAAFSRIVKMAEFRTLIPDFIKARLNLTDKEYAELFVILQQRKYLSQLQNIGEVSVGNKKLSGTEIKEAILAANDEMINRDYDEMIDSHNEANMYTPKVNAVVAKVDTIDEIPKELLDFAKKYNLPILILGR